MGCGRERVAGRGQSRAELHEPGERGTDTSQVTLTSDDLVCFVSYPLQVSV